MCKQAKAENPHPRLGEGAQRSYEQEAVACLRLEEGESRWWGWRPSAGHRVWVPAYCRLCRKGQARAQLLFPKERGFGNQESVLLLFLLVVIFQARLNCCLKMLQRRGAFST
jgi:hypothetical protein